MINCPKMPAAGTNKISGIYKTVQQILKVLPMLDVHGDGKTIKINESVGGKIISALPQANSAITQGGGGASAYDGPWSFTTTVNVQGNTFLRVKGGYFNRNGLFVPMNVYRLDSLRYYDFNLTQIITDNNLYYVHIYQEWIQSSKVWRAAEVRVTHDAPPEGIPLEAVDIYGYCLLGWIRRSGNEESGYTYDWECYGQAVPTMFVAGECRTGEV